MKIATLQINSRIRQTAQNIAKADSILASNPPPPDLDLLVLPELAFTGYNFPSLEAIKPHLEPTTAGPTTIWAIATAKRLNCHVTVGYPERSTEPSPPSSTDSTVEHESKSTACRNYNSTVTVSPAGQVLANYRKSFLYYTDESWASEGPAGFYCNQLGALGKLAHGICMDINPYQFTAAWDAYEFARHVLAGKANLVVLSMAWLTHSSLESILLSPDEPALETVGYWVERFSPLVEATRSGEEVTVVFANRIGTEANEIESLTAKNGQVIPLGDSVNYAGSSCVMRFQGGKVSILDMLGQAEEGMLYVDTIEPAKYELRMKERAALNDD